MYVTSFVLFLSLIGVPVFRWFYEHEFDESVLLDLTSVEPA